MNLTTIYILLNTLLGRDIYMNIQEIDDLSVEQIAAMMGDIDADEIVEEQEEKMDELSADDFLMLKGLEESDLDDVECLEESELSKAIKKIAQSEAMEKMLEEAYENQDTESDFVEKVEKLFVPVVVSDDKEKPVVKKTKTPKSTTAHPSRENELKLGACPKFYYLEASDLLIDPEDVEADSTIYASVMERINKMNVKTGAKCVNLLCALNGTTKTTTFVESGARYVTDYTNVITREDFISYFMSQHRNKVKSYNKSTAIPQASTLLSVFVELMVLKKEGGKYVINPDGILIKEMEKAMGKV